MDIDPFARGGMTGSVLIYRSDLLPPSETFIVQQAAALREFRPVFAGLRRVPGSLPSAFEDAVMPRGRGERLLFQHVGYAPSFQAAAKQADPVLLHAHFAPDAAEALPLVRRLGVPLIATLHGYDVMCADAVHARTRRGRLYLARRKELWAGAAAFFCVSEAIRQKALTVGFPGEKLLVLPIGVDTDELTIVGDLPSEPTILFVGRLVPKKGCDVLLRAMRTVQSAVPEARLIIAGDGPERAALESFAAEHTRGTRFLGVQTPAQVRELMRTSRCLAAPSVTALDGDAEGLPTVLCEALALGLPVASTFHSGIPELITHGEHGLLTSEGDADGLAQNLLALCTDDRAALLFRSGGRRRVERFYNLSHQTALLEAHYRELTTPAPKRAVVRELPVRREPPRVDGQGRPGSLRRQTAWLLSGNGAALGFQALYFLLIGRMLGASEYGAFVGVVALINVMSQFSSLGMEMVLLRTVSRDRTAFAAAWGRALVVSLAGFCVLFCTALVYGRLFLSPTLRVLLPYLAVSDALFGKVVQLSSRALQGAGLVRWSAKLQALTNAARAAAAAGLFLWSVRGGGQVSVLLWARVYCAASLAVAVAGFLAASRLLGRPQWTRVRRAHLAEGLSFSLSSSAISVYNDIDKAVLASEGMLREAGVYGAAYRVIDVLSTPLYSLFAAASPGLFREGAAKGPPAAMRSAQGLLRWAVPFGFLAAAALFLCAPLLPKMFGPSFAGSVSVLRFLCLLPLLRGLHYAWGTAITACASQWLRTGAQAGVAAVNLLLNLVLIPRWGWHGAAAASLLTDGSLALLTFLILRFLAKRSAGALSKPGKAGGGALQCAK